MKNITYLKKNAGFDDELHNLRANKKTLSALPADIQDHINTVFVQLKEREINPSGRFDNGGRWYADNGELLACRAPSRAYPYSEMTACRTRNYVLRCAVKFNTKTLKQLQDAV